MAIETFNYTGNDEIKGASFQFTEASDTLKNEVQDQSRGNEQHENNDENPEIISLKNGYEIIKYGSRLVFDLKNEAYGFTIQVRNGEMVFSTREAEYTGKEFELMEQGLTTPGTDSTGKPITIEDIIGDTGDNDINKMNIYLEWNTLPIITDSEDIKTIKQLLLNLKENDEIKEVSFQFKEELNTLKNEVQAQSGGNEQHENNDENPEIISLKNGYEIIKYGSRLVFDLKNEAYGFTIQVRNGEMVFSTREAEYTGKEFELMEQGLTTPGTDSAGKPIAIEDIIGDTGDNDINKMNIYLEWNTLPLIKDPEDIKTIKQLLLNLKESE